MIYYRLQKIRHCRVSFVKYSVCKKGLIKLDRSSNRLSSKKHTQTSSTQTDAWAPHAHPGPVFSASCKIITYVSNNLPRTKWILLFWDLPCSSRGQLMLCLSDKSTSMRRAASQHFLLPEKRLSQCHEEQRPHAMCKSVTHCSFARGPGLS